MEKCNFLCSMSSVVAMPNGVSLPPGSGTNTSGQRSGLNRAKFRASVICRTALAALLNLINAKMD